jgi:ABC-2 type transport system permease protein
MFELFLDAYHYRKLIWLLTVKELKIRYHRSVLGFFWALLHPLLMAVVLTLVFSTILRFNVDHYPIFLLSTLFPWTFFSQALAYATESIVGNGELLKKVYVPAVVFPLAAVLANLINFALSFIPLALLLLAMGFPFHATWLYLPIPILLLVAFTVGLGFVFASANVFFRDMSHIQQIVLAAWFYFSPIIYDLRFIDPRFHVLFRLNPMLYILNGFRLAIYGDSHQGLLPSAQSIAAATSSALIVLIVGYWVFRRYRHSFVYYV